MSVQFVERRDDVSSAVFSHGLASTVFLFERDGRVFYTLPDSDEIEEMSAEDVARLARLLGDAAGQPERECVGPVEQECVEPVAIGQLRQLLRVTYYADLMDAGACARLAEAGFALRARDHYCLTKAGLELCGVLGLLDGKENEDES